jgi:hypothetical protein
LLAQPGASATIASTTAIFRNRMFACLPFSGEHTSGGRVKES